MSSDGQSEFDGGRIPDLEPKLRENLPGAATIHVHGGPSPSKSLMEKFGWPVLIALVGAFAGAGAQHWFGCRAVEQVWMEIREIRLLDDRLDEVRFTLFVNSLGYAYPERFGWLRPRPGMQFQAYPLAIGPSFDMRLEMEARDRKGASILGATQRTVALKHRSFPTEKVFKLYAEGVVIVEVTCYFSDRRS